MNQPSGPLSGLRVIEFSGIGPGPHVAMLLADLGAEVVRVDRPGAGVGNPVVERARHRLAVDLKSDDGKAQVRAAVANADVLITTAAIPGRRSPLIVSEAMIGGMKNGALVVDMAAEGGGNCAGTVAGKTVKMGGVTLIGPLNLPARMPVHASEMFARNLFNFISPWLGEGALNLDWDDEIVAGACLTREGELVHAGVRNVLGL